MHYKKKYTGQIHGAIHVGLPQLRYIGPTVEWGKRHAKLAMEHSRVVWSCTGGVPAVADCVCLLLPGSS